MNPWTPGCGPRVRSHDGSDESDDGHTPTRIVTWSRPFQVLRPSGPYAELDRHRAWRPSVLQGVGPLLRMWYGGHDGSTARILAAKQFPRQGWARLGASIEPGFTGSTDAAGVGAPSVVDTDTGYLMAYAGSDGTKTRVHLATSADGYTWHPGGPFRFPDGPDASTTPCLVTAFDRRWLYFGAEAGDRRPTILAATSAGGAAWQDVGPVLEPESGERSVSEPWIVAGESGVLMFFVARDGDGRSTVGVATSDDGLSWARRPAPLDLARRHHDAGSIGGPSALRLRGGHLRLWYAAGDAGAEGDHGTEEGANEGADDGTEGKPGSCRLWSTELNGRNP
jgi:hypothetical protein